MDITQNAKKKISKKTLIGVNIFLVIALISLCLFRVQTNMAKERQSAENSYIANVSSMRTIATSLLTDSQKACADHAAYITANNMSMDDILEYLSESVSGSDTMYHVIDYDTFDGYSSVAKDDGSYAISYASFKDIFSSYTSDNLNGGNLHITSTYTNPITAYQSIGFVEDISVLEKNTLKHYMLINVAKASDFTSRWQFPQKYSAAQIALMQENGDYIIRPSYFKNENFWEFIRINNNLGYDETSEIKKFFYNSDIEIQILKDASGIPSYVVCLPFNETTSSAQNPMYYVAMIPVSDLAYNRTDYLLVFIVAFFMLLFLLFNGYYILDINKMLRQSNKEALLASKAKTAFLSSMSHDIRTPMNAIIGLTTIASHNVNDPSRVQDCLSKINMASNHLLTLINDILDISKIESGKITLNPAIFSLSKLISDEINIIQSQIKAKNMNVDIHVENVEHEMLFGDELRLNQIFINLMSNAVKYTDEGGKIIIDISEKENADTHLADIVYKISDNGMGMTPEFVKILYEPFSRMSDTRHNKVQGTGLGLAITKQMVDLMNGTIECESELGVGTTFTVHLTLPIAKDDKKYDKLPHIDMLVADDDSIFLSTSIDTLNSINIEPDTTLYGKEAVKLIKEKHENGKDYDVVIIDWKMPDQSGEKTIKSIRDIVGKDTTIIVVSSYQWEEIEEDAIESGADYFITKPIFKSSIYKKLCEIMNVDDEKDTEKSSDIANGLHDKKFLVAEDNDVNWEILDELLHIHNIQADHATNGKEALKLLEESGDNAYDAIFMDIHMPIMNGLDTTKEIRKSSNEYIHNIPIIAMTADAFAEDVKTCLDAGMNAHTSKPININKLFDIVRDVLSIQ